MKDSSYTLRDAGNSVAQTMVPRPGAFICKEGRAMGKAKLVAINHRGRRIGGTHQRAKHPESVVERIRELRAQGLGYRRISAKLKMEGTPVPWSTVREVVKGNIRAQQPFEWKKRGAHRAEPTDPRHPLTFQVPDFHWLPMPGGDEEAERRWDENNAKHEG